MRVFRFVPLVSVGLVLAACEQPLTSPDTPVDPPSLQAVHFDTNLKVPFAQLVFISCVPEFIVLQGTLHILTVTTIDDTGGFHTKFHFQPQGATGTGPVSGDSGPREALH